MASIVAASAVVAPAAFAAASSSVGSSEASTVKAFSGLKAATVFSSKTQKLSSVQNGSRVNCMQVGTSHFITSFMIFRLRVFTCGLGLFDMYHPHLNV
jgi:ribulose-bisphosphate carboxylase small chain